VAKEEERLTILQRNGCINCCVNHCWTLSQQSRAGMRLLSLSEVTRNQITSGIIQTRHKYM